MKSSYTPLAQLSPDSDGHTILVRVTRIWEAINKRNGTLMHTNMILLDEKDNHIIVIIRNNQKQIYLPQLKEEEIYTISNFKVVPGPKQYRAVDADYAINFFYKTKIQRVGSATIPLYKFELKSFADVKNLVGNVVMLIDVVGMVKSYGRLEKRSNGAQKMDVVLANQRSEPMVVTLWEDRAMQFLGLVPPSKGGPIFVVFTGLLAKKFSDAASLSSTDATRCYVNIDYAPLNAMKDALIADSNDKKRALQAPTLEEFVTSTGDTVQELPISTILETVIPQGTQLVRCICRAKIVAVLDGNGWYYNCCPTCARALGDLDGKFYCLACEEEIPSLAQRFRIVIRVEDGTGSTTLTLFNKEAEQLVGVPLEKILVDQQEENQMAVIPPVVNNIIGKMCVFQVKITSYNIIHGCEEYTVTRVSEIDSIPSYADKLADSSGLKASVDTGNNKRQKLA